jgi:hypothetical protein
MSAVTFTPSARAHRALDEPRGLAPEPVHRELDVRDLHGQVRVAPNRDDLIDRPPERAGLGRGCG